MLVATGALGFVAGMMELPSVLPWQAAVLGLAASVLVGLAAGVAPARRAAALESAATLRE